MGDAVAMTEDDMYAPCGPAGGGRRGGLAASVGLAAVSLAMALPTVGAWCRWSPDNFWYLKLARSVAETGSLPPQQLITPPGFAWLLAPLLLAGELPLVGIRLLLAGCWAALVVLTYWLHRDELGHRPALLVAVLVVVSPVMLDLATSPLSDLPFAVLLTAAILAVQQAGNSGRPSLALAAAAGLLTAAACLTRAAGVVVIPVVVFATFCSGRRRAGLARRLGRAAVLLVCAAGPLAAWQVRQSRYPAARSYFPVWTQSRPAEHTEATGLALQIERVAKFGPLRLESLKELLVPRTLGWRAYRGDIGWWSTWVIGGGCALIAAWRALRRGSVADGAVVAMLLLLAAWPYDEGVRFVAPLLPIIAAYPAMLLAGGAGRDRGVRAADAANMGRTKRTAGSLPRGIGLVLLAGYVGLQAAGFTAVASQWPTLREKSAGRLAAMRSVAHWVAAAAGSPPRVLALTPEGHHDKLVLAGAAYLGRWGGRVDSASGDALGDLPDDIDVVVVSDALAPSVTASWGLEPSRRAHGLVLFARPGTTAVLRESP